ncbi:unnamed protein product [Ambrosiozyma monospora]|uniref:Unnamed protein product n=1 Tax=Ambrosiozyma monospora TaxID=43982 RepID=A0A9W6Z484_AMBMO|nr:unnamed protein product [Ambrosiozyma monospora]
MHHWKLVIRRFVWLYDSLVACTTGCWLLVQVLGPQLEVPVDMKCATCLLVIVQVLWCHGKSLDMACTTGCWLLVQVWGPFAGSRCGYGMYHLHHGHSAPNLGSPEDEVVDLYGW